MNFSICTFCFQVIGEKSKSLINVSPGDVRAESGDRRGSGVPLIFNDARGAAPRGAGSGRDDDTPWSGRSSDTGHFFLADKEHFSVELRFELESVELRFELASLIEWRGVTACDAAVLLTTAAAPLLAFVRCEAVLRGLGPPNSSSRSRYTYP